MVQQPEYMWLYASFMSMFTVYDAFAVTFLTDRQLIAHQIAFVIYGGTPPFVRAVVLLRQPTIGWPQCCDPL
jgi:hypothetical protein